MCHVDVVAMIKLDCVHSYDAADARNSGRKIAPNARPIVRPLASLDRYEACSELIILPDHSMITTS